MTMFSPALHTLVKAFENIGQRCINLMVGKLTGPLLGNDVDVPMTVQLMSIEAKVFPRQSLQSVPPHCFIDFPADCDPYSRSVSFGAFVVNNKVLVLNFLSAFRQHDECLAF